MLIVTNKQNLHYLDNSEDYTVILFFLNFLLTPELNYRTAACFDDFPVIEYERDEI